MGHLLWVSSRHRAQERVETDNTHDLKQESDVNKDASVNTLTHQRVQGGHQGCNNRLLIPMDP